MSNDTSEVRILADVAGEVAAPASRRRKRPANPTGAPSRNKFRAARRRARWRRRANVMMMFAALCLMTAGLVFFLSEDTGEPTGPPVVAGESTIRGATAVPTTAPAASTDPSTDPAASGSAPPPTVIVPADQTPATVK